MLRKALIVTIAALLTGCASAPKASKIDLATAPCLPPGTSAMSFAWPVVDARPFPVPSESGKLEPGLWVRYQEGRSAIVMVWSSTGLLAVDPSPDTQAPAWLDMGLLREDGKTLRLTPRTRCQWRQVGGPVTKRLPLPTTLDLPV